jgi:hypothetical protein
MATDETPDPKAPAARALGETPPTEDVPNQGATGTRPLGETPLTVETETDAFAERPEAYVGAAFAGGLALALILRRLTR